MLDDSSLHESEEVSPSLMEAVGWPAAAFGIALAAADVVLGMWDHDSGMFLLHGGYVAEGMRPYIDFASIYLPLNDMITGLFVRVGINRLVLAIGLPILWMLANSLASAYLAWSATRNRGFAVLLGALFPLFSYQNGGNHVTLEHPVSFFAMLALAMVLRPETLLPRHVAFAALWSVASIFSKQNGAVVLLPLAILLWLRRSELSRRHVGFAVAGAALLPLITLVWLRFDVAAFWRNTVTDVLWYAGSSPKRDPAWIHDLQRAPASVFLYATVLLIAIVVAVRSGRFRWLALSGVAGAAVEFLPRLSHNFPHYNITMWPFLALVIIAGAVALDGRWRALPYALLLVLVPAAWAVQWRDAEPMPTSPLLAEFYPAAHIISEHTKPNGVVRQYGSEPILEFLADRHEERIDKGTSLLTDWEQLVYTDIPAPTTTVVTVFQGQPWYARVMADLPAWGFEPVGRAGRVTVWKKQDPGAALAVAPLK